ncbi:MAG TPA: hypothetical protein VGR78_14340 [Verrucomicrobiae bacterium]|jgi:hypothetical protein|nr:hypothetical protein [Verrucomicrobiae bacterium]
MAQFNPELREFNGGQIAHVPAFSRLLESACARLSRQEMYAAPPGGRYK